jgi:DNA-binding response OmpR family regulator
VFLYVKMDMPGQYSILVIGDDPNLRGTLALILERAGYRVTIAAGTREGLNNLEQMTCHLVLVDALLADEEGRWLLRQIRHLQPGIPVIWLAAQTSPEFASELWHVGTSGFLSKPIEPKCILAQVHALLIEKQILPAEGNSHGMVTGSDYRRLSTP